MMPAISLNPLPPIPLIQLTPEPERNFEAVLEAVSVPVSPTPAPPAPSEPSEALLNFLGINPVKGQAIAPNSSVIDEDRPEEDAAPPATEPFPRESIDPDLNIQLSLVPPVPPPLQERGTAVPQQAAHALPPLPPQSPRLTPNEPLPKPSDQLSLAPSLSLDAQKTASISASTIPAAARETALPEVYDTPPSPQPVERPSPKSSLSLNIEEKAGSQPALVQTELSTGPGTINQPSLTDIKAPSPQQPVAAAQATDPLHFIVERHLDLARDNRWLDSLARDIVAVAETPDRLSFRLSPPQLGRLDVDLNNSENGLSVRMNASSEAATQIIAAAQPRLIDELKNQGVRVADTQVSTGGGQTQGQSQQHTQRDADQMIEYARARFEAADETNSARPQGRFA